MMPQLFLIALTSVLTTSCLAAASEPMSREFKLSLDTAQFAQQEAAARTYATRFKDLVKLHMGVEAGAEFRQEKARQVRYLDTPGSCKLARSGYILRERTDGGKRQLTLKLRHADSAHVMQARLAGTDAKSKLEEDVSPPMNGRLSRSASIRVPQAPTLLGQAAAMFPILAAQGRDDEPLQTVGALVGMEAVYGIGQWQSQGVEWDTDLTFWNDAQGKLLFAEASFRYSVPEQNADQAALAAQRLFLAMQADAPWVALSSPTKTEFAYKSANGAFCTP